MSKVITSSDKCLKIIEHFECSGDASKYLKAYQDTGDKWTIGIGTIRYMGDAKVQQGDTLESVRQAYQLLEYDLKHTVLNVDALTTDFIDQHQLDALCSFVYNIGVDAYRKSTIRRLINANPSDYKNIVQQFLRWKYDEGIEEPGLLRRRKCEAYLYVYGELKFYFTQNDTII